MDLPGSTVQPTEGWVHRWWCWSPAWGTPLSWSAHTVMRKQHSEGGWDSRYLSSQFQGETEDEDRGAAWFCSCPHAGRGRPCLVLIGRGTCLCSSSYKATNPIVRTTPFLRSSKLLSFITSQGPIPRYQHIGAGATNINLKGGPIHSTKLLVSDGSQHFIEECPQDNHTKTT